MDINGDGTEKGAFVGQGSTSHEADLSKLCFRMQRHMLKSSIPHHLRASQTITVPTDDIPTMMKVCIPRWGLATKVEETALYR